MAPKGVNNKIQKIFINNNLERFAGAEATPPRQTNHLFSRGYRSGFRGNGSQNLLVVFFQFLQAFFTQFHRTNHHTRSEEHTSELQSREKLVCRLLLEKKNDPE